jgi:hypothetical protein
MSINFTDSNLSKIKPKLRTQGQVTGNFGKPKMKANSPLRALGETKGGVGNLATKEDYLNRLYYAFDNTDDEKLKKFIYGQIRNILVQQGKW